MSPEVTNHILIENELLKRDLEATERCLLNALLAGREMFANLTAVQAAASAVEQERRVLARALAVVYSITGSSRGLDEFIQLAREDLAR